MEYGFEDLLKDRLFWKDDEGNLREGEKYFKEELKRMENALKTSFSSSPMDKTIFDHRKKIMNVFINSQI